MTLGADVGSRVNHLTVPHRRWCLLSVGGEGFVFLNFPECLQIFPEGMPRLMLCHLFSRRARSPGPLNKSSSLFLLRGKRLRHSWVLGVTSHWCWCHCKFDIPPTPRQVKHSSWKPANVKSEEVRQFLFAGALSFQDSSGSFNECAVFKSRINPSLFCTKRRQPHPNLCPSSKDLMTDLDS